MYKGRQFNEPGLGAWPLLPTVTCRCVCLRLECCRKRQRPLFIAPCDRNQDYAQSWFPRMRWDDSKSQCASSQTDATQNRMRRDKLGVLCMNRNRTGIILKLRGISCSIRNFNNTKYNTKIWIIYIKMISMTYRIYWYN